MKSFTDNMGRAWTLVVNVATIKRVRALCGVDLNTIVVEEDGKPSAKRLERLSCDPVLLVDVLYAVCKLECDQRNVSDEDFGVTMAGDAIEQATDALLDEVIDFFLRGEARDQRQWMEAMLADGKFEKKLVSELERLTGLSCHLRNEARWRLPAPEVEKGPVMTGTPPAPRQMRSGRQGYRLDSVRDTADFRHGGNGMQMHKDDAGMHDAGC